MQLCVFGAASDDIPEIYITSSEALGAALAERGHGLIFGGGASGVMGAVCRGAAARGGRITGVAPRFFDKPGVLSGACGEMLFTDTMARRKALMEERADGFIAAPGGVGTLDELFQVLTLRHLGRHEKPVALFSPGGYYDGLIGFLRSMEAQGFVGGDLWDCFAVFREPEPLLDYMETVR